MDGNDLDSVFRKLKFLRYEEKEDGAKSSVYTFRAEIPLDVVLLLFLARYKMYVVSLEVYDPDRFGGIGGTKVVVHTTLSKEQIIKVVRKIPDAHRIEQTLEFVKKLE